jgi:hypothetical protein
MTAPYDKRVNVGLVLVNEGRKRACLRVLRPGMRPGGIGGKLGLCTAHRLFRPGQS